MQRLAMLMVLLMVAGFAVETVAFEDSWGEHPQFNIVSQTRSGMEIVFSLHEMLIEDMVLDNVSMQSYGLASVYIPQAGAPSLGGATRYVAVPQGARVEVVLMDYRTEVYQGVEVLPAPNIPLDTDDAPLVYEKDMAVYGRDAVYPSAPVQVSEPMQIRGVDVVIVNVTPFGYNPMTKELVVYKDLRFRLDYVGGNGRFGDDRLRSRFWEPVLAGHLLNYQSLPQVDFYAAERMQSRDGYEYIIIVPDDPVFEAWADTIKAWRILQGISCEVFTLTEIGGNTTTAIENFLNTAYATWDPAPVAFLILSDYPSSGDVYGVTTQFYSGAASDNMYADVNGDHMPDMHHARICAQNATQLGIMINKFLGYERDPYTDAGFYDHPLTACGWQTERWFQLCSEIVRGFFINALSKDPAREYNIYQGTPVAGGPWSSNSNTYMIVAYFGTAGLGYIPDTNPYDATWWNNGSSTGITNAINSGAFMVQHRDHGGETGWGEPNYTNANLNSLTNTMYTFVNSSNCLTGKYNWYSECFSEKFHRMNYGALGLNAASEVSYSFVNDTYVWGSYDAMWPDFMPGYPVMGPQLPVGQPDLLPCMAMTSGKYFLQQSSWPYNSGSKTITYHLFHHHGDAFSILYSEIPVELTVSHLPVLFAGHTSFTVTANDNSVIALTMNGEIIGVVEGTGSPVAITVPAQVPGDTMKVTVTKANYYRYEADVPVVAASYPYVLLAGSIIDDAAGNGDGMINAGETIDLGIWAKNVGSGTAQSVFGLLSESDGYVTLGADSSWYSNIPEDDSTLSSPYYAFTVASSCPDGFALDFVLEFHDTNDSIFESNPQFTVYAPVLTCQDAAVVGGNNNGKLDPGETADLVVTIDNEGSATATNATSTIINVSSNYVTVNDAYGNFGTINPGATMDNAADPFNVTADAATPHGTEVVFDLEIVADFWVDTVQFSVTAGQLVASDTGYYYAYYSGGPHTASPVFDWIAIDTTQTVYSGTSLNLSDEGFAHVPLPFTFTYYGQDYNEITVSSNGWISMVHETMSYPSNYGIPSTDGPAAMIAGIWDNLDPGNAGQPSDIYYYYDAPNNRFIVEYFQVEHYTSGYHETFEIVLYNPDFYETPTGDGEIIVQYLVPIQQIDVTVGIENATEDIGIQYYNEGTYHELAEPVTDNFAIKYTTYPPGWVGVAEQINIPMIPLVTAMTRLFPNPVTRYAQIQYQMAVHGRVTLQVFDAAGRAVRTLVDDVQRAGYYTHTWDGHDDAGRKVSTGVYFVRFRTDEHTATEKIIIMK